MSRSLDSCIACLGNLLWAFPAGFYRSHTVSGSVQRQAGLGLGLGLLGKCQLTIFSLLTITYVAFALLHRQRSEGKRRCGMPGSPLEQP